MKLLPFAALAALLIAGCEYTRNNTANGTDDRRLGDPPRPPEMVLRPAIHLSPSQAIGAGTSVRVIASTENIVEPLNWACSPNDGKLSVERATSGQSIIFTSTAPGTYIITASAKGATGDIVESATSVRVDPGPVGNTTATERTIERPRLP